MHAQRTRRERPFRVYEVLTAELAASGELLAAAISASSKCGRSWT
jgi:hypothetical protein